jgi:hypothetical protein
VTRPSVEQIAELLDPNAYRMAGFGVVRMDANRRIARRQAAFGKAETILALFPQEQTGGDVREFEYLREMMIACDAPEPQRPQADIPTPVGVGEAWEAWAGAGGAFARACVDAVRQALSTPTVAQPDAWQGIETAPSMVPIIVRTVLGCVLMAHWDGCCSVNEDGNECGAWVARDEGVHPACWTHGMTWTSNEDGEPSDMPVAWLPAPPIQDHPIQDGE